jgi:hypothetical protein
MVDAFLKGQSSFFLDQGRSLPVLQPDGRVLPVGQGDKAGPGLEAKGKHKEENKAYHNGFYGF